MLEAMVVVVSEIESNILEGRSTGDAGNAASRGMSERHLTISLSLDGHILWQVGQSVVACLDNLNHVIGVCSCNSLSNGLILGLTNLSDRVRLNDFIAICFDVICSRTTTDNIANSSGRSILIPISQILSNSYVFRRIVSNNTIRISDNTAKVAITRDSYSLNCTIVDGGAIRSIAHDATDLIAIVV